MNEFIYLIKRWGIGLVILGVLFPTSFYFLELAKAISKSAMMNEFVLSLATSIGVSITGVMIIVVCESLKRKSMRALAIIVLVGIYNSASGFLFIFAYPKNAVSYFISAVGIILIIQSFRIRRKMKTLI